MVTSTKASRQAALRRAPSSRLVATPDLLVPRPPRPAMSRPRLFDALDDGAEGRLVLISAPAGAGKTALLSTWLSERPRKRVAWMSLRPRRGENAFWAEFLEALRGVVPASTALAHLAAPRAGTPPGFVDRLLSAVARLHAPVTLVMDDFHNVPRTGVSAGIEQLLRSSSPHLRLVISTRHDPDLPIHVFRASGELVELRAADLAFTEDEARQFLAAMAVELQPALFQALLERTEGWAAGLRLFTLSLQGGGIVDALQHAFAASDLDLASSCLVESWFDLLVDADLTMQTALTDALPTDRVRDSVPLTAVAATLALMSGDVRRGGNLLDAVPRAEFAACDLRVQAMFVFACLFRHRLEGECSKAAKLAERLLELADAGFTAGRTADRVRALALGFLGICEIWLRRPAAQSNLHKALYLARAADVALTEIASLGGLALIELGQGRLRRASELARSAVDSAESGGLDRSAQAVHGYTVLALADYEWNDLDAAEEKARALGEVALTSGDRIARVLSALVDASISLARGGGEIEAGIQRLKGIESDWKTVDAPALRAACATQYSRLAAAAGDLDSAHEMLERASADSPESRVPIALARLRLSAGEPDEALTLLAADGDGDTAVGTIERAVLTAVAHRTLGHVEESREATGRALALGEAESIRRPLLDAGPSLRELLSDHLRHSTSHRWFASDLLSSLNGNGDGAAGPAELLEPLTAREADVLHYLPTNMSNADIAGELFVSVNTIKSHVKSIYRKLDATQRRDAVRRARQLHLL